MAEQLSSHTNSASELVLEALLDLVYWKRRGKMKYSSESSISSKVQQFDSPLRATPLSTRSEAPEAAKYGYLASLHGPEIVQSLESHRNNSAVDKEETTSLSAIERTPDPVIRQDMQTTVSYPNSAGESELSLTTDASTTSGNASNSSSLMSLFSWGNRSVSTKPISLVEKLESIPELSVSPKLVQDGGFVEDFRTLSYTSAVSEESHSRGQFKAIDSDILASPIHKAVVEAEESGSNVVEFEQILLPQVIEAVVKVLYKSTSPQQVKYFFSILENSITIATQTESLEHLLSHFQNANLSEKLVKECNDQAYRNAEAIFQQRDWLLLFTDMLSYFRRKLLNAEDSDTGGQLAPSDNESVGDLGIGREYVISPRYNTSADGDDSFVGSTPQLFDKAASNSFFNSSYRARPTSVSSVSEHSSRNIQSWISPFTQPVLSLTRRLLLLDMGNKVSASRRYQELFRLSSPETYDIQEIIVLDLLTGLESFKPSKTNVDVLRNIAVMLEQFLDKGELSLLANMRAVKTLHLLTYNCPLDVRQYLKNETNLTEIRKSYVCRCVIDTSQELYLRVIALSEIISPLKEYLMSTDSQLLSAKSIVLIILSMFIDVFEDLEFLFTATDTDEFFDSLLTRQGILESNTGNTTYDRLQMSTEMMHAVIVLVQSCSETSVECRKVLIRICSELKGDPELLVLEALTNSFGKMNTQEIQESAISSTAMAYASPVPPVSKGSEASSQPASSSWWGVWSSYTEPAMEGENKEVLKSDINNTEKRKSEKKLDSATTPDIEMGDSVSADSQSVSADEPVIECASSNHAERPNTVLSFISWFCNIKQR